MTKKVTGILGPPRSGTSWLGQIMNSSPAVAYRFQPLFSYDFKNRLSEHSSAEEIHSFFHDIMNTDSDFVLQRKNISGNDVPVFEKHDVLSHLVFKEVRYIHIIENLLRQVPDMKILGIIRNPCATIHSWLNAPREFDPSWNRLKEWKQAKLKNLDRPEEFNGFDKWKEAALLFIRLQEKYPSNFRTIRYEKLHSRTLEGVNDIFRFCELEVTKQTTEFIRLSKSVSSDDPYSVLKKNKDMNDWRNSLEKEIGQTIETELKGTVLEQFLYE